jgi:cysteinyl-tRNA synthetase
LLVSILTLAPASSSSRFLPLSLPYKEDIYALTNRFIAAMHEDERALGILPPDIEPRATDAIDQMFYMIGQWVFYVNSLE